MLSDILNNIVPKAKAKDVSNFLPVLNLAIGQEYDFVKNLDTLDGITNGTPCVVKYYQKSPTEVIWVDTKDKKIGAQLRQSKAHLYRNNPNVKKEWTPVVRESITDQGSHFKRSQFPLRPGKCRTPERLQGATCPKVVVDYSSRRSNTDHAHYVAFSRCPSKKNVFILGEEGLAVNKIKHNAHCMEEMCRLREESLIKFQLPSLSDLQEDFNSIYFLNCQSLIGKENALNKRG